jgi:hypothetical protein
MSKYINVEEIEKVLCNFVPLNLLMKNNSSEASSSLEYIAKILSVKSKTADVVEVCRCEKCKYYILFNGRDMCKRRALYNDYFKEYYGLTATDKYNFCSYGEREEIDER